MLSAHNPIYANFQDISPEDYLESQILELEQAISHVGADNISCFIGETILGELIGDVPPHPSYWKRVKDVLSRHDILLILDEVYCGLGISGKYHCCEYDLVIPDFLCVSKTLAAGYIPFSGSLIAPHILGADFFGTSAALYYLWGHLLGASASLQAQSILSSSQTLAHINTINKILVNGLSSRLASTQYF